MVGDSSIGHKGDIIIGRLHLTRARRDRAAGLPQLGEHGVERATRLPLDLEDRVRSGDIPATLLPTLFDSMWLRIMRQQSS